MDALDYLKAKSRMTNNCEIDCRDCLLEEIVRGTHKCLQRFNPEKAIELIEKWSKENPAKTYASVIAEKFPKFKRGSGCITHQLFGEFACRGISCEECLDRPYEED